MYTQDTSAQSITEVDTQPQTQPAPTWPFFEVKVVDYPLWEGRLSSGLSTSSYESSANMLGAEGWSVASTTVHVVHDMPHMLVTYQRQVPAHVLAQRRAEEARKHREQAEARVQQEQQREQRREQRDAQIHAGWEHARAGWRGLFSAGKQESMPEPAEPPASSN